MTKFVDFAERLVWFRAGKGMTQRELSELSGVSLPQITRYETGKSTPRLGAVLKIAAALELDPSVFTEGGTPHLQKVRLEFPEGGDVSVMFPKDLLHSIEQAAEDAGIPFAEGLNNLLTNSINLMNEQLSQAKTEEERLRILRRFRMK